MDHQQNVQYHEPLELEYPGMEWVLCFGLVISLRTCYYDTQIHVGDSLKKSSNDIPQISKCWNVKVSEKHLKYEVLNISYSFN